MKVIVVAYLSLTLSLFHFKNSQLVRHYFIVECFIQSIFYPSQYIIITQSNNDTLLHYC